MLIHKQLYALCHHSYCYNTLPAMPAWPQFTKEVPMKLVNQQLIKNTNLKLLYNSIFENRGISRAALAKKTGLSRTAVSALIDELTESGFLYDSGTGDSAGVAESPTAWSFAPGTTISLFLAGRKKGCTPSSLISVVPPSCSRSFTERPGTPIRSFAMPFWRKGY